MDFDPPGEGLGIAKVGRERRQIEPALLTLGIRAFETMGFEERRRGVCLQSSPSQEDANHGSEHCVRIRHAISKPRKVPLPVENSLTSIPRRWSIETNRFVSG